MGVDDLQLTRREALVFAALLAAGPRPARAESAPERVPTRRFGRSPQRVSILGLGGYFDPDANDALVAAAYRRGVRYWEATLAKGATAYGRYFRSHPSHRKDVFLLAKARSSEPAAMQRDLERSLREASTSHVDFFIVQGVSDPGVLTDTVRSWVKRQKAAARIRHFGFSTHANMGACLGRAAELAWIDGVVTAYNYRLMDDVDLQRAVAACGRAGVAVTAIKSQALPSNPAAEIGVETPVGLERLEALLSGDVALGQAKLQAVWSNPAVASALSMMDLPLLEANSAATRPAASTRAATDALRAHARATRGSYCAGCAQRCESRVASAIPISKVMRYRMYASGYGDTTRARDAFNALSESARRAMADADYSEAERACPQGIAIGRLMRDASRSLGGQRTRTAARAPG